MAESPLNVPECVARARSGDDDAGRALVVHLYPLVLKIVRAHRPRRESEEDLAQEVFMKLFAGLDTWRGATPFEHWVARIAVNTCVDRLRAQRLRPELRWADLTEPETKLLEGTTPADTGQALDAQLIVGKLLDTLRPPERLVIQLLDLEQKTVAEIHALTGWSASLIKVRAFRARRKLRRALAALERKTP